MRRRLAVWMYNRAIRLDSELAIAIWYTARLSVLAQIELEQAHHYAQAEAQRIAQMASNN